MVDRGQVDSRKMVVVALCLVLGLLIVACAPAAAPAGGAPAAEEPAAAPAAEEATLQVWVSMPAPAENVLRQQIARFEEENVQTRVELVNIPSDYLPKLLTAIAAGNAPDVAELPRDLVLLLPVQEALQPLDTYAEQQALDLDDFLPDALESNRIDGSLYGLPRLRHACSPRYENLALFQQSSYPDQAFQLMAFLTEPAQQQENFAELNPVTAEQEDELRGRLMGVWEEYGAPLPIPDDLLQDIRAAIDGFYSDYDIAPAMVGFPRWPTRRSVYTDAFANDFPASVCEPLEPGEIIRLAPLDFQTSFQLVDARWPNLQEFLEGRTINSLGTTAVIPEGVSSAEQVGSPEEFIILAGAPVAYRYRLQEFPYALASENGAVVGAFFLAQGESVQGVQCEESEPFCDYAAFCQAEDLWTKLEPNQEEPLSCWLVDRSGNEYALDDPLLRGSGGHVGMPYFHIQTSSPGCIYADIDESRLCVLWIPWF